MDPLAKYTPKKPWGNKSNSLKHNPTGYVKWRGGQLFTRWAQCRGGELSEFEEEVLVRLARRAAYADFLFKTKPLEEALEKSHGDERLVISTLMKLGLKRQARDFKEKMEDNGQKKWQEWIEGIPKVCMEDQTKSEEVTEE